MKTFLLFCLAFISVSQLTSADTLQEDLLHVTAHAGATYVITHSTEVICKKITGKKLACTLVGMVLANGVNIGYKAGQGFPTDTKRAVASGLLGSGSAALMIALDF